MTYMVASIGVIGVWRRQRHVVWRNDSNGVAAGGVIIRSVINEISM